MSAPEHKSDIGKRLDEARLGMTHGIDVLLKEARAEIDRLRTALQTITESCAYGDEMCTALEVARRALEGEKQ